MICQKCGSEYPDDALACSQCGAAPAPAPVADRPADEPFFGKLSCALALLGLLCLGIGYLTRSMVCFAPLLIFSVLALICGIPSLIMSANSRKLRGFLWALLGTILGFVGLYLFVVISIEAVWGSINGRVRADMFVISRALNEYHKDHGTYPEWSSNPKEKEFDSYTTTTARDLSPQPTFRLTAFCSHAALTTPVGYITSHFSDPYSSIKGVPFRYWTDATATTSATGYILWSAGPDSVYDLTIDNIAQAYDFKNSKPSALLIGLTYDPSNGISDSGGDIWRAK